MTEDGGGFSRHALTNALPTSCFDSSGLGGVGFFY